MKKKSKRYKIFLGIVGFLVLLTGILIIYATKVYFDIKSAADQSYAKVERTSKYKYHVNSKKQEPFSVLLLGVDTGDFGRTEQGRSDSIMVATVNPEKEKTTLISIPRDTYTEISGKNRSDKINHAYAYGGVAMSIATVEKLLDIPIDYYVEINMKGIQQLIDAVGGVEVNNPFTFTYEGKEFKIGKLKLNGTDALKYSRMRYEDPKGDYGRQNRQRQVVSGIIEQLKSIHTLTNYNHLLTILGDNTKTDISWKMIESLVKNYRPAFTTVKTDQLTGEGFTGDGTVGEQGISYQKVSSNELKRVQEELKGQLK
ncbi:LCP family protein [Enterococcus ratti]|uniref:Transcriptional regulator LytR n=1 Tax=Enterococcus ratti TaxID=150033 RepID=A0A1L8WAD3_9ENTE|nr:LCP family protein [Enterococcus ratti]OJG77979.1 transcriptional regulator LytR [Enterococcus ratti]